MPKGTPKPAPRRVNESRLDKLDEALKAAEYSPVQEIATIAMRYRVEGLRLMSLEAPTASELERADDLLRRALECAMKILPYQHYHVKPPADEGAEDERTIRITL